MKKLIILFLMFCLLLCGCGNSQPAEIETSISTEETLPMEEVMAEEPLTIDTELVYEQAKLLHIQLESAAQYRYQLDRGCREELNLLFLQSTEYEGMKYETIGAPGLYMLDLDTGIWYDGSFLDWTLMSNASGWNLATRESALMCFFSFYEQNGHTSPLWSDEETLIDMDPATLEQLNQRLLLERLTRQVAPYPYSSIDEEPRKLSDEELAALANLPAGYIKSMISTVSDAIAYLDMRFPELWMGLSVNNGVEVNVRWHRPAQEILYYSSNDMASRACIANCLSYLLDDDYAIESLIAFWPDPNVFNDAGPEKAINLIKTADGYLFFDAVVRMRGDAVSRKGFLLPEMTCNSVAEYIEHIRQTPELAEVIKYIFKNTGGVRMDYVRSFTGGYTITTDSPGVEMVYYSVPAKEPGLDIIPENIDRYKISKVLGGTTLTAEEAYALVDADPEVVQEKVKTAADVLMYMLAARIGDSMGCKCTRVGRHTWHWNMSAKEVMTTKLGNCGSCANLANYLLDGDYEEVGFMDQAYYPGNGGSHVYTYVLHEGKYYILDYSWYIFNDYAIANDYGVPVLDSLEQWPSQVQWIYGSVCLVMTYDTAGMQYPVIFGEDYEQEFGYVCYVLPEGAEYTVLYEAPDGYQYHHIPFDTSYYDWNVYWKN